MENDTQLNTLEGQSVVASQAMQEMVQYGTQLFKLTILGHLDKSLPITLKQPGSDMPNPKRL